MIRDNYIPLLVLLLHRLVSPSTGTHDGKLSVGLPRHPTIAKNHIGNSSLDYVFRVRRPWGDGQPAGRLRYSKPVLTVAFYLLLAFLSATESMAAGSNATVLFYYTSAHIPSRTPTASIFLPYVGYVNEAGEVTDWFFDSTILIDLNINAVTKTEWSKYLDVTFNSQVKPPRTASSCNAPTRQTTDKVYTRLFADGVSPILGLNLAAICVGRALHDLNTKHGVILTIPWKSVQKGIFDPSAPLSTDLSQKEGIVRAAKWFVAAALARWSGLASESRSRLYLKGFYWLEESQSNFLSANDQRNVFNEVARYISSKGLAFFLSPYNKGFLRPSYDSSFFVYFDNVWLQPNAWPPPEAGEPDPAWVTSFAASHVCEPTTLDGLRSSGIPVCEIADMIAIARNSPPNVGVNIEWRMSSRSKRTRVFDYLELLRAAPGLAGRSFVLYDDAGLVFAAAYSGNKSLRDQYDGVYGFLRFRPSAK